MRAVFLDRDGTINKPVLHRELGIIDAPFRVEQFELMGGVGRSIHALNEMGLRVVVVTNQAGIAKGKLDEATLGAINDRMRELLAADGARVDGVYWCPHHPEEGAAPYRRQCNCRKPSPGLLRQAAADLDLDLAASYVVGDSYTDILAGQAAGCRTIILGRIKCDACRLMDEAGAVPDGIASTLWEAVQIIRTWEDPLGNLRRLGEPGRNQEVGGLRRR
ncbi:MAG: HAD family hydrolase [Bacteroidetes bacterium]|nr:HAD family hydrolase [Bacteroidota bacterium]MCL5026927.1 HAD family hydrolase [Chloroflexota bacterium]